MMSKIGALISDFDVFGEPVSLNFRGKTSFQTKRGGALTLGIYAIVLW